MNKTTFLLAALLIAFIGILWTPTAVLAQCPTPAPNDHPDIPFIQGETATIETPWGSGCFMTFNWCWRVTPFNGGEPEIYVGQITRSGNCSETFDVNNLIRIAAREIIVTRKPWETRDGGIGRTLPTPIPPCPALSRIIYRILHASCYSEAIFDPNTGNQTRFPCGNGNSGRCEEAWRVCWEPDATGEGWHLNETLVEVVNNGATCPENINDPSGNSVPCLRICN